YWLFRLGMPQPVRTTVAAPAVGARRDCLFDEGLTLVERITTLEPGRNLTFDIVAQPAHPEIMGHIELTRGQLLLQDNGDATTTLIGSTDYRLLAYPACYYDLWAESICRAVHRSVMGHIKRLAEARH